MKHLKTCLAAFIALAVSSGMTACSADSTDEKQDDPSSQNSELSDKEKTAAQTTPTAAPTATPAKKAQSLVETCTTCGPLPDPWTHGPLPDPWGSATSTPTDTTPEHK